MQRNYYDQHSSKIILLILGDTGTSTVPKAIRVSPTPEPAIQNAAKPLLIGLLQRKVYHAAKPVQKVPKSVQAVTHHKLSFTVLQIVGMGYNGEFILCDSYSPKHLHKMKHNSKGYIETWIKKLPDGIKSYCWKGVSSDSYIFLQNDKDEDTVCYDESLTRRTELHIQGMLIDSTSEELFYAQGTRYEKDYRIIVHKPVVGGIFSSGVLATVLQKLKLGKHKTLQLKPPSPREWNKLLSVCRMKLGYVVVEFNSRIMHSMDIFDEDGRTLYALKLYSITEISVRK